MTVNRSSATSAPSQNGDRPACLRCWNRRKTLVGAFSHEGYNVLSESTLEAAGLARPAYAYAYHPAYSYGYYLAGPARVMIRRARLHPEAACGSHVTSRRNQDALELIGRLPCMTQPGGRSQW